MKQLFTLILALLITVNLFGQDERIKELVIQGIQLHDKGKYNEAIAKYQEALEIESNSLIVNYELSYTFMEAKRYSDAVKHSRIVLNNKSGLQSEESIILGSYIVLGSSLDLIGKPEQAIKTYEEGLEQYPDNYLLNYNLSYTTFVQKDYEKAESASINAITANPQHGSSHAVLAETMRAKGLRVKSVLALYYFLMIEPNSQRSALQYKNIIELLFQGIEKTNENQVNVNVPSHTNSDSLFGAAEMAISLLATSRFIEEDKKKSEIEWFYEITNGLFSILSELKKDNTGIWWDLYVTKFKDLIETDNCEPFCYYISQSSGSAEVAKWIEENNDKMQIFKNWLRKK